MILTIKWWSPQDGKEYARKDANWVEVQGGDVDSVNGETGDVVLDGTDIPLLTGTTNPTVTEAIADIETDIDGKVSSLTDNEPTGSNVIFNVVSLTQADYDAGTPIATTFYLITDA